MVAAASDLPGGPPTSWLAAMNHATSATKPGLRNSDGWIEVNPRLSHRVAPLPKSVPITGSATTVRNATAKITTPSLRTCRGDIIEITSITTSATPPKIPCRLT